MVGSIEAQAGFVSDIVVLAPVKLKQIWLVEFELLNIFPVLIIIILHLVTCAQYKNSQMLYEFHLYAIASSC